MSHVLYVLQAHSSIYMRKAAGAVASAAEHTYKIINFFYMTTKVGWLLGGCGLRSEGFTNLLPHLNNNNHKSYFGNARAIVWMRAAKKKKKTVNFEQQQHFHFGLTNLRVCAIVLCGESLNRIHSLYIIHCISTFEGRDASGSPRLRVREFSTYRRRCLYNENKINNNRFKDKTCVRTIGKCIVLKLYIYTI